MLTKARLAAILLTTLASAPAVFAHPDRIENDLLLHFATGTHPIENGQWPDLTHTLSARVHGAPVFTNVGPARALVFNGYTDWLEGAGSFAAAEKVLPKPALTVAAWIFSTHLLAYPNGSIGEFVQALTRR